MNTAAVSEEETHQEHHDHGLSDVGYIKVALLLAVLTAVEVATYFWDFGVLEVPSLLILMVVKFQIVVSQKRWLWVLILDLWEFPRCL